jgi:hypothetical protein
MLKPRENCKDFWFGKYKKKPFIISDIFLLFCLLFVIYQWGQREKLRSCPTFSILVELKTTFFIENLVEL